MSNITNVVKGDAMNCSYENCSKFIIVIKNNIYDSNKQHCK